MALQFLSSVKPVAPMARRAAPEREFPAGDRLPYAAHIDDFTIATRDGILLQFIELAGLPFETADGEEIDYRKTLRDSAFRAIANSRFALYQHVIRREAAPGLTGAFDDDFSRALNEAWQRRLAAKKLYVNRLYLTIARRPLQGKAGLVDRLYERLVGVNRAAAEQSRLLELRELTAARESLLATLAPYGARALKVYDSPKGPCSEPLEFLSSLYNGEHRPMLLPAADLGRHLPHRRISFGSETLELSAAGHLPRSFGAILSIKEYPPQTAAGMMDDLLRLPFEMTVSQSFGFVDRQVCLERMNTTLRRMRSADDEAASQRLGLQQAKDEVASGHAAFGEHHLTVAVYGQTLDALDNAAAEIQSSLADIGLVAVREDVNLEAGFWAQFPGNFRDIARRALVSTANFAGFASGHNFPTGRADANHWGPSVTVLETTSAGPYHFNFHNNDLGNFTLIGPSGSGKTVVLGFLLAQARKFNPRIVYFDKDRGAEIFLRALGGRYDAMRQGQKTGFNPLALEDTPANRAFLADWCALLVGQGEILPPEDMARIHEAVDANYAQERRFRRLRYFVELFRGDRRPHATDLAARLAPWCGSGEKAWLFDNECDELDLAARTIGFDMTQLLDDRQVRSPAMLYLFHRIEQRLDGEPAIIVIDEGWKALDDDIFVRRIKDWEKTIRKRNGLVGFATQSASDALESRIASAVIEQAATQIFMANPKAQARDYIDGFGLTEYEFALVRELPDTSRCFLIKHGNDSVVARLNLAGEPDILKVLSGRERTVRLLDRIRQEVGDDPAAWLPRLLEAA